MVTKNCIECEKFVGRCLDGKFVVALNDACSSFESKKPASLKVAEAVHV